MSGNHFIEIDGYRINISNIEYIYKLKDGSGDVAIHFVSGRHIMIKSYDKLIDEIKYELNQPLTIKEVSKFGGGF